VLLTHPPSVDPLRDLLTEGDFQRPGDGVIYRTVLGLSDRGVEADSVSVVHELRRRHYLDAERLAIRVRTLASYAPTASNVRHHASLVAEAGRLRRTRQIGEQLAAQPERADELVEPLRLVVNTDRSSTRLLEPLDLDKWLAEPPAAERWLIDRMVAKGDLVAVVAAAGTGKSVLMIGLANAVRRGGELFGFPCSLGRVGLVDWENSEHDSWERLRGVGFQPGDTEGLAFVSVAALQARGNPAAFDLTTAEAHRLLDQFVAKYRLDVLILDSLRPAAPELDENDSREVERVLGPLRELTRRYDVTVILLHNTNRLGEYRGSTRIRDAVDVMLGLRPTESGLGFTVEMLKHRRAAIAPFTVTFAPCRNGVRLVRSGEGSGATAAERLLDRICSLLSTEWKPRPWIAEELRMSGKNGTFTAALKLGMERGHIEHRPPLGVGDAAHYRSAR
jgi:KaiC/GvpD/RAD55 family RecA-like ATPase